MTPDIYFYHGSSSASSYTVPHNYPSCLLFFKQTLPILFLLSESSPLPLTPRQPPPLFFPSSLSRFALSVPLGLVKSRRYTKAAGKESQSHFFSSISDEILCLLTIYSFPYQYYYDWLLFRAGRMQNWAHMCTFGYNVSVCVNQICVHVWLWVFVSVCVQ